MSESKSSYGEPVEEPRPVDDVVDSANQGIADAEAARRNAVADETAAHESHVDPRPSPPATPDARRARALRVRRRFDLRQRTLRGARRRLDAGVGASGRDRRPRHPW